MNNNKQHFYTCNHFFYEERKKRHISRKIVSCGIISQSALADMENGKICWKKVIGDILMQRIGITSNYFETFATAEELKRWRLREDIVSLVLEHPKDAQVKLNEYRTKYNKCEKIEEQFLLKLEVLLLLLDWKQQHFGNETLILDKAKQAASITIVGEYESKLDEYWLAPAELEAVLLVAIGYYINKAPSKAWNLQQAVWNYPQQHNWDHSMKVLILPQTALFRMRLLQNQGSTSEAYQTGKEILKLLQNTSSQRYVLPLLDNLISLSTSCTIDEKELFLLQQFRDMFSFIYQTYNKPQYRLWQTLCVHNTHEVGLTLKMLRKSSGISVDRLANETIALSISSRELQRIENGYHRPCQKHLSQLTKHYHRSDGWGTMLLDTHSTEVLCLKQKITNLLKAENWKSAEQLMEQFERSADMLSPRNRQALLLWKTIIQINQKKIDHKESIARLKEALQYTIPDIANKKMEWWVYQGEETMIMVQIALCHQYLENVKESKRLYECLKHSMELHMKQTQIPHMEYITVITGYTSILNDMQLYNESIELTNKGIQYILNDDCILHIEKLFYDIAWNKYELSNKQLSELDFYRNEAKKNFKICELLALYNKNETYLSNFLESRKEKYLCTTSS